MMDAVVETPSGFEYWPHHEANRLNKLRFNSLDSNVLQISTMWLRESQYGANSD